MYYDWKLLFRIHRLVTGVKESWTSAVFTAAPENTWFGQVYLNNMDESSFETFEKPSVKEVTKHPKVALWHDHSTAHGTEEFKTCQVNNYYRSKSFIYIFDERPPSR